MDQPKLLRTPLYDTHLAMGARMVEFAGWEMPIQFAGIIAEHNHTRAACSVFDVSHMGRLTLTGKDCEPFLNRICTRNLAGAEVGRSFYSHVCREDGGILDDVIVSRFEDRWGVVCNGSNRDKIVRWIARHAEGQDVTVRDDTLATAMIACQGPKTMALVEQIAGIDLGSLKRYRFQVQELGPIRIVIYRCGYTGEDGIEVVVPAGMVQMLIPKLLGTKDQPHAVIKPAGLGARDTLRIEAAMPLYGHELCEDVDSLTAGQGWCVDLCKEFIGVEPLRRLKERGLPRKLVGLALQGRRIARQQQRVYAASGAVGEITSGTLSPTLGNSIAMAFVGAEHAHEGATLEVDLGRSRVGATVVKLPFYNCPK